MTLRFIISSYHDKNYINMINGVIASRRQNGTQKMAVNLCEWNIVFIQL